MAKHFLGVQCSVVLLHNISFEGLIFNKNLHKKDHFRVKKSCENHELK